VFYHFINNTHWDCFLKKQGTVETATYGLGFAAVWTAAKQIMDLNASLHQIGVPIKWLVVFGDN
jgi:hypothetical protein